MAKQENQPLWEKFINETHVITIDLLNEILENDEDDKYEEFSNEEYEEFFGNSNERKF